jgi:hypothetical protein
MEGSQIYIDQIVRAGKLATFSFTVDKNQEDFAVSFSGSVTSQGNDLHFMLMSREDYEKWNHWRLHKFKQKTDPFGKTVVDERGWTVFEDIPEPKAKKFFDLRSNLIKEEVSLPPEFYTLVLDNTHSVLTDKDLHLEILEKWRVKVPVEDN